MHKASSPASVIADLYINSVMSADDEAIWSFSDTPH